MSISSHKCHFQWHYFQYKVKFDKHKSMAAVSMANKGLPCSLILLLFSPVFSQETTSTENPDIEIPAEINYTFNVVYNRTLLNNLGTEEKVNDWIKKLVASAEKIFHFKDSSDNSGLDTKINLKIVNIALAKPKGQFVDGVRVDHPVYNRTTIWLAGGGEGYCSGNACMKGIPVVVGVGGVTIRDAEEWASPDHWMDGLLAHEMGHSFGLPHDPEEFARKNAGHSYAMRAGGSSDRFSSNSNAKYRAWYKRTGHKCLAAMAI